MERFFLVAFGCLICASNLFSQNSFWEKVQGPPGGPLMEVFHTSKPDTLYGTWGEFLPGLHRSVDNGLSWSPITVSFDGLPIGDRVSIGASGSFFYKHIVNGYPSQIYVSTNEGGNWHLMQDGIQTQYVISESETGVWIEAEAVGQYVKINRSMDKGSNWTEVFQYPLADGFPHKIEFQKGRIVLKSFSYLFQSADDGENWLAINDPGLNEKLVITSTGTMILYGNDGFYHRSTNNGITWDSIRLDNPTANFGKINSIITLPSNRIMCSNDSESKIFISDDDGITWESQTNDQRV